MQDQLQQRLNDLQAEYESGQQMLADLEARQTELRETMLRISGAIQVLEELLGPEASPEKNLNDGPGIIEADAVVAADALVEQL